MEAYVFGDQTTDCRAFLQKAVTRKEDVLLNVFLEKAVFAIRDEISKRAYVQSDIPDFGTIDELVDRYYKTESADTAIESTLVCLSQLIHFIGYAGLPPSSSTGTANLESGILRSSLRHTFRPQLPDPTQNLLVFARG